MIGETGSFRDYESQQRGNLELERVFAEMPESVARQYQEVPWIASNLQSRIVPQGLSPGETFYQRFRQAFPQNEIYAVAREFLDRRHPVFRVAATVLYLSGGAGFGVLLMQNIWFVAQHW